MGDRFDLLKKLELRKDDGAPKNFIVHPLVFTILAIVVIAILWGVWKITGGIF